MLENCNSPKTVFKKKNCFISHIAKYLQFPAARRDEFQIISRKIKPFCIVLPSLQQTHSEHPLNGNTIYVPLNTDHRLCITSEGFRVCLTPKFELTHRKWSNSRCRGNYRGFPPHCFFFFWLCGIYFTFCISIGDKIKFVQLEQV